VKKYLVLKTADIERYLSDSGVLQLSNLSEKICDSRQGDGKSRCNHYLIVNTDEPYAGIVADLIEVHEKDKSTWDHGDQSLREVMGIPGTKKENCIDVYKSGDYCRSIKCPAIGQQDKFNCQQCGAYGMHQYLKRHGQILEEGSDLTFQLAEAQADNVALRERLKEVQQYFNNPSKYSGAWPEWYSATIEQLLYKANPGDSIRKELEQLRARVKAYNGFEPCDFKSLDAKNKGLEESIESYKTIIPELLQLRKIRGLRKGVSSPRPNKGR
jgi:hypothetical protein